MNFSYKPSIHDLAATELFGAGEIVPAGGAAEPCLLIGFVNRSGSNYLAELLHSTGGFAGMAEALNDHAMRHASTMAGIRSSAEYVRYLRTTQIEQPGQIWGVKANWAQVAMLLRWRAIPNLLTPTMVIVSRRDVIAQAVSLYIASHTQQWRSNETAVSHGDIKYDGKRIMNTVRSISRSYGMLKQVTVLARIPYHEVHYEDLLASPEHAIGALTEKLGGRRLVPRLDQIGMSIQRNALNAELKARFLEDLAGMTWSAEAVS